jgi:16S rRNA (guanine1207-N2)-methyltransferase
MGEHYFSKEPAVPSSPTTARLHLPGGLDLPLVTDRGVFSEGHIDPGTRALLRVAPRPPLSGDLLDLGCGYGAIACALAAWSRNATVWAIDVNPRALELVEVNALRLGLSNIRAVAPEGVPPRTRFSGIWSNPPIRVGKAALHQLLATWLAHLADNASAWLVVNRHLGADSLATWLVEQGWAVQREASKSGYRVLKVGRGAPVAAAGEGPGPSGLEMAAASGEVAEVPRQEA